MHTVILALTQRIGLVNRAILTICSCLDAGPKEPYVTRMMLNRASRTRRVLAVATGFAVTAGRKPTPSRKKRAQVRRCAVLIAKTKPTQLALGAAKVGFGTIGTRAAVGSGWIGVGAVSCNFAGRATTDLHRSSTSLHVWNYSTVTVQTIWILGAQLAKSLSRLAFGSG